MSEEHVNKFRKALEANVSGFGLEPLTENQLDRLAKHYEMMREWNRHVNLTRIVEPREAARLHYADSLFGARFIGDAKAVLDIGSGAGFPAIPLAVLRPDLAVTALEANHKKSVFLFEAKDALELPNLDIARSRLEEFDWSSFDLLASRALDRAEDALRPLVKRLEHPQRLMLYCGPDLIESLAGFAPSAYRIERHAIPQSDERFVAVFARG
ncbi:MAG TPA: 16S rRNA (guanine(527)-N(7))-methyltransferase RsmG [Blastocatellia bacterium]|jgi:16S rRNA (guanine527-N7)-methyltransferase|nr:16S rRNA (guanine(527)-N(7))-methyltransferase RsmG [Blastocatellia bacterium]